MNAPTLAVLGTGVLEAWQLGPGEDWHGGEAVFSRNWVLYGDDFDIVDQGGQFLCGVFTSLYSLFSADQTVAVIGPCIGNGDEPR